MRALLLFLAIIVSVGAYAACGDPADTPDYDARPIDAAEPDAEPGTPDAGIDADCFTDPVTHYEIINACTTAQRIEKNPTLPLQLADGGLPPLP